MDVDFDLGQVLFQMVHIESIAEHITQKPRDELVSDEPSEVTVLLRRLVRAEPVSDF